MKKALMILLCLLPVFSLAEVWDEVFSPRVSYRCYVFEQDVPEMLRQPLREHGYTAVQTGALRAAMTNGVLGTPGAVALVCVEKDGALTLIGLQGKENGWLVTDLGEKMLLPGREMRILLRRGQPVPFYTQYASPNGVVLRYAFWTAMNRSDQLWTVEGYERQEANGDGLLIRNSDTDDGLIVCALTDDPMQAPVLPVCFVSYTAYMDSLLDFPTTEEAAQALSKGSWKRFEGTDTVMLSGDVNLRKRPTARSESLGRYHTGTLAHALEQTDGASLPWLHVRVGDIEGYISAPYYHRPTDGSFVSNLRHLPLPLGITTKPVSLRKLASDASDTVCELARGAAVHVMGERDDGWLHVSLPTGEIDLLMNENAPSGYVRRADLDIGSIVSLAIR